MKNTEITEIVENIKRIEGYESLTPIKHRRNVLKSDNGEFVVITTTKSKNQNKKSGNFQEIPISTDDNLWREVVMNPNGCYYVIVDVNGQLVYYRTDIKTVIFSREKDSQPNAKNRYLIRIPVNIAEDGEKFLPINGGRKVKTTIFYTTKVDVEHNAKEAPCYVYLMTDNSTGATKIGIANDPRFREGTLLSERPTIVLKKQYRLNSRSEALAMEKALHKRYEDKRCKRSDGKKSEWFNLSDRDLVELLNEYDWRQPVVI